VLVDVLSSRRSDLYKMESSGGILDATFDLSETYPKASVGYGVVELPRGANEVRPDAFKKMRLNAVAQYHAATIRPDLTTIVVAGDVSPDEAKAVIEKWFGDWKGEGPIPRTTLPPIPLYPPSFAHISDPGAVQDSVTIAEQLDLNRFDRTIIPCSSGKQSWVAIMRQHASITTYGNISVTFMASTWLSRLPKHEPPNRSASVPIREPKPEESSNGTSAFARRIQPDDFVEVVRGPTARWAVHLLRRRVNWHPSWFSEDRAAMLLLRRRETATQAASAPSVSRWRLRGKRFVWAVPVSVWLG
jgi:Peptidase M16 inactive domain